MVVLSTISTSPTMVYFGQEVGEPGDGNPGFGAETRTTIFDYWGVPNHIKWMNNGAFDGELLNHKEKELRAFYRKLLNFTLQSSALLGEYREIHSHNREHTEWYNDRLFSYTRWQGNERLIIVVNFDATHSYGFDLRLPPEMVSTWGLVDGTYTLADQLTDRVEQLSVTSGMATTRINLDPLESLILKF